MLGLTGTGINLFGRNTKRMSQGIAYNVVEAFDHDLTLDVIRWLQLPRVEIYQHIFKTLSDPSFLLIKDGGHAADQVYEKRGYCEVTTILEHHHPAHVAKLTFHVNSNESFDRFRNILIDLKSHYGNPVLNCGAPSA